MYSNYIEVREYQTVEIMYTIQGKLETIKNDV